MSDSAFNLESSDETSTRENPPRDEGPPRFGVLDIVEAFTAMRHEWRGQTKESRELADQVQAAVTNLQALEAKLLARAADSRTDESHESRKLAQLIAETDHQLSRAVALVEQAEANRSRLEAADVKAIELYFNRMNAVARWFARPLLTFITELRPAPDQTTKHPVIEGLNLVLARLRRTMKERHIERLDAEGQVFDATTMNAIGTVASKDYPAGHVAEQLSPGYRWQGQLLRFADVRVAK